MNILQPKLSIPFVEPCELFDRSTLESKGYSIQAALVCGVGICTERPGDNKGIVDLEVTFAGPTLPRLRRRIVAPWASSDEALFVIEFIASSDGHHDLLDAMGNLLTPGFKDEVLVAIRPTENSCGEHIAYIGRKFDGKFLEFKYNLKEEK